MAPRTARSGGIGRKSRAKPVVAIDTKSSAKASKRLGGPTTRALPGGQGIGSTMSQKDTVKEAICTHSSRRGKVVRETPQKQLSPTKQSSAIQDLTQFGQCEERCPLTFRQYRMLSWNINSVRAWVKHGGLRFLEQQAKPYDIIGLQEMKCAGTAIPAELRHFAEQSGYTCYFLSGVKGGYSGVAVLTRIRPDSVRTDLTADNEGRVIDLQFDGFHLVNCYTPNSGIGLKRLGYRMEWNKTFLNSLTGVTKPIIICGDLNVAHMPIDLCNPDNNHKTAGFTDEERNDFSALLDKCNLIDTFRHLYPDKESSYTFWSYRRQSRAQNVGWRLDYFLTTSDSRIKVIDHIIHADVLGSDHCPIELIIDLNSS